VRPDALVAAILILIPPGKMVNVDPVPPALAAREGRPIRLFPATLPLDPLAPRLSLRSPPRLGEASGGWLDELDVELESDLSFIRCTFTAPF